MLGTELATQLTETYNIVGRSTQARRIKNSNKALDRAIQIDSSDSRVIQRGILFYPFTQKVCIFPMLQFLKTGFPWPCLRIARLSPSVRLLPVNQRCSRPLPVPGVTVCWVALPTRQHPTRGEEPWRRLPVPTYLVPTYCFCPIVL